MPFLVRWWSFWIWACSWCIPGPTRRLWGWTVLTWTMATTLVVALQWWTVHYTPRWSQRNPHCSHRYLQILYKQILYTATTLTTSTLTQTPRTRLRLKFRGKERTLEHLDGFPCVTLQNNDSLVLLDASMGGSMVDSLDNSRVEQSVEITLHADGSTVRTEMKKDSNGEKKVEFCVFPSESTDGPERADGSSVLSAQVGDDSPSSIHERCSSVKFDKTHERPLDSETRNKMKRQKLRLAKWIQLSSTSCPHQVDRRFPRDAAMD